MHMEESFAAWVHRRSEFWWGCLIRGLDSLPRESKIIFMYWPLSLAGKNTALCSLLFRVKEDVLKTLHVVILINSWNNDTRRHRHVPIYAKVSADLAPSYSCFFFTKFTFTLIFLVRGLRTSKSKNLANDVSIQKNNAIYYVDVDAQ